MNEQAADIVLHFDGYRLRMAWNGPDELRANQVARVAVVRGICGPETFNTRGLDAAIESPNARIAYATLAVDDSTDYDKLPAALQRFLYGKKRPRAGSSRRRIENPAAFYVYYADEPCILQYLCVSRKLKGLGLGRYIYQRYEWMVRFTQGCSRIMLASIDDPKVVDFYVNQGFRTADPPIRGPGAVDGVDERGQPLRMLLPGGTMFMVKALTNQAAAIPLPAAAPLQDDGVAEVPLFGSQRLDESRDDDARQIIDLTLDSSDDESDQACGNV